MPVDVPAVKVTEQLAEAPLPLGVQLVVAGETDAPLVEKLTVPVGVMATPADVSVTVTVQALVWLNAIGVAQLTLVDVVRLFTVCVRLADVLVLKLPSPA